MVFCCFTTLWTAYQSDYHYCARTSNDLHERLMSDEESILPPSSHGIVEGKCGVLPWWIFKSHFNMADILHDSHKKRQNIDGLVQERRNSIANALELHLSCTNPSTYSSLMRARYDTSFMNSVSVTCSTFSLSLLCYMQCLDILNNVVITPNCINNSPNANSLWPSGIIWWHRSGQTLVQVIVCCLKAPSHQAISWTYHQCSPVTFTWEQFHEIPQLSITKISFKSLIYNSIQIHKELIDVLSWLPFDSLSSLTLDKTVNQAIIGSDNGLLPFANKPLFEPMLAYF